jgi:hypothetical protein
LATPIAQFNKTFVQAKYEHTAMAERESGDEFVRLFFTIGTEYFVFSRTFYTALEVLAETGGMIAIIFGVFRVGLMPL